MRFYLKSVIHTLSCNDSSLVLCWIYFFPVSCRGLSRLQCYSGPAAVALKRPVEAGGVEMWPLFSVSPPQMLVGGHRTDF